MTREAFETALNHGLLETCELWPKGWRWFRCRRNGATRTWKRSPERFEIPIKYKFNNYWRVTDNDFNSGTVDKYFRIRPEVT